MGCPQSKTKTKDLPTTGNDGNGHVTRTRNDAVRPEEPRVPTKHPHEYNDDPLVCGRVDPNPPDIEIDKLVNEKKSETNTGKTEATETARKVERAIEEEKKPDVYVVEKDTYFVENGMSQANVEITKEKVPEKSTENVPELTMPSVFMPDESFDSNESVSTAATSSEQAVLDVGDISIGQAVSEVEMNNQTVNIGGEVEATGDAQVRSKKSKGAKKERSKGRAEEEKKEATKEEATEKRHSANDSPNIRYQNRDNIEYGLPADVPGPAPPKTKKADLIRPGAFTIVDKIVDQAPDDAPVSMTSLASYLSGQIKKDEVLANTDTDDGDTKTKLPAPAPTKTKKPDIVPDVKMFKKIDDNARNTPESVRLSVEKLAAHLCTAATSDLEKVRAFYFWICHNISYSYEKDSDDARRLRQDAVSTLRQGKGSNVNLIAAFCKEASIPCVTIPGCSKGLRHNPDKEFAFGERNHSWNAVYINGEWRFIDCTWGSGYLDSNGKFHQQFDEFWFLTDPEVFAYDHFPAHPDWQLLEEPIDLEDFNKKPSLTERSRELGFKLISHREPIVYVQNEVTISFGTEKYPLSNITVDFRATDGGEVNRHRCMRRIDNNTFEVRAVPPQTGQYSLILFGKARDYRHAKYRKLMEYTLRVETIYQEKVVFPNHIKAWGPEPNYAEYGFAESIETLSVFKTDTNELTINLGQTKKTFISPELKTGTDLDKELGDYTMVTADDNSATVHCRFPTSGYYRLDIYALGPKTEKLEYCAAFLIECTVSDKPKIYPKYNGDSISKHGCELLEPLDRELPNDSFVTFRLKSAGLRQAMIGLPTEEKYGSRLVSMGELKATGGVFSGQIKTPKAGQAVLLSGSAAPPNVFWSRVYEFVTV